MLKKLFKVMAITLCVSLAIGNLNTISNVSAASQTDDGGTILDEDDYYNLSRELKIYGKDYTEFRNNDLELDISDYNLSKEQAEILSENLLALNLDLYYLDLSNVIVEDNIATKLCFTVSDLKYKSESWLKENGYDDIEAVSDSYIKSTSNEIYEFGSDFYNSIGLLNGNYKILYVHDFLAQYYRYTDDIIKSRLDYVRKQILDNKGYAYLFNYLANTVGFNCRLTKSEDYYWNIVEINDSWYNVDVINDVNFDNYLVNHNNFLVNDSVFSKQIGISLKDFKRADATQCIKDDYDDYYDINNYSVLYDNFLYYSSKGTVYDVYGYKVEDTKVEDGTVYCSSGVNAGLRYNTYNLAEYGDRLFYTYGTNILGFDGKATIIADTYCNITNLVNYDDMLYYVYYKNQSEGYVLCSAIDDLIYQRWVDEGEDYNGEDETEEDEGEDEDENNDVSSPEPTSNTITTSSPRPTSYPKVTNNPEPTSNPVTISSPRPTSYPKVTNQPIISGDTSSNKDYSKDDEYYKDIDEDDDLDNKTSIYDDQKGKETKTKDNSSLDTPVIRVKSRNGKTITVKINKVPKAQGYQIKYGSSEKNLNRNKKQKSKNFKIPRWSKKLEFYFKVRAYRTVNTKTYHSKWTKVYYVK